MMNEYSLKRSPRSKYIRLTVRPGGTVVVTAPLSSTELAIRRFVAVHANWIQRAVERMKDLTSLPISGRRAYEKYREEARTFIRERVLRWNDAYKFRFGRIAIKNLRTMWGSCSTKGNLNFSYKLLFLPRGLADYIVVHELCHLGEHNHTMRFWSLVASSIPDYKRHRRELRRYVLRA